MDGRVGSANWQRRAQRDGGDSSVADPNRALFESVVRLRCRYSTSLSVLAAARPGLFITDPAAGGIRLEDVDAIVDVVLLREYTVLAERLRALGLAEDMTPGAPLAGGAGRSHRRRHAGG